MFNASMLIGTCIALFLWLALVGIFQVPAENRSYRDAPATGFRVIWPFIRLLVFYTEHHMPSTRLDTLQMKLARAGAEYSLDAKEVLAAKLIAAALFAALSSTLVVLHGMSMLLLVLVASVLGYNYPDSWLRQKALHRQAEMLKALPFYLDVITLSVEAGSNLTGGLTQAVQKTGDSPLRRELSRVLREIRSGKPRSDALRDFAGRANSPAVNQVVSGLIQGEKAGANLGPMLRAQAEQLRTQRFQLAEKKAMEAPVKLLGPLFTCIFPMTFVALGFVMLSKAILGGFLDHPFLLWAYTWPGV
ncbi:MAG: type II secretion system F family protein [Granulosicoccus sp.]